MEDVNDKSYYNIYGYTPSNSIAIIWCIDDVKQVRPDLNDEDCLDVLYYADRKHDASMGITYDTLQYISDYLYPQEKVANG